MKNILKITAIIALSFVLIIGAFYYGSNGYDAQITSSGSLDLKPIIIIDAGHGGFDGGAVADDGTVEKDINLSIALKLGNMLRVCGYNVIFTREEDKGTDNLENGSIAQRKKDDLKNRLELMSGFSDAVFVSIHLNKFSVRSAKGAQVFYSPNGEASKLLSNEIQNSVKEQLQKDNSRVSKIASKDIYLLYNAPIPAVIVECGFISNPAELTLLKDENYQTKLSFAVLCGILSYYS